jgi:hypothetical protein
MLDVNMQHLLNAYCQRILVWFWWGSSVIINALYTSVLVSLLVIIKFDPLVHSLDELAIFTKTGRDFKLCVDPGN